MPINADKPYLWKKDTLGLKVEPLAGQQLFLSYGS